MILLIDAGNSRIKWASLCYGKSGHGKSGDGQLGPQSEILHSDIHKHGPGILFDALTTVPDRVLVSNVAGESLEKALMLAVREQYDVQAEFVQTSMEACGIRNGYGDPKQMGVDRWVAMIGARAHCAAPVCVIDAGTAVTIDVLDKKGVHLGGLIAPGFHLMAAALNKSTSDIDISPGLPDENGAFLGHSTQEAIRKASYHAVVAFVEQACTRIASEIKMPVARILTGGDGLILAAALNGKHEYIPELVLRGLKEIAEMDN